MIYLPAVIVLFAIHLFVTVFVNARYYYFTHRKKARKVKKKVMFEKLKINYLKCAVNLYFKEQMGRILPVTILLVNIGLFCQGIFLILWDILTLPIPSIIMVAINTILLITA